MQEQARLELAIAAVEWLGGHTLTPPPGTLRSDGWVDLSKLDLVEAALQRERRSGGTVHPEMAVTVDDRTWTKIDFTGTNLNGFIFQEMNIQECKFDNADLRDTRWSGCTVSDSTFTRANLGAARLSLRWYGTSPPSQWINCSFDGAKYSLDSLDYTEFIGCRLNFATWRDIKYSNCRFENCTFSGRMVRVEFISSLSPGGGRPNWENEPPPPLTFDRCDFTGSDFVDIGFYGCTFNDVTWARGSWLLEVPRYGEVIAHAEKGLGSSPSGGARLIRVFFVSEIHRPPRREATLIFNLGALTRHSDEVVQEFIEVFKKASDELGLPSPVIHGSRA